MGRHLAIAAIYFGKYPSTFKYWMQSCGLNKDIDFYLISDYVKPDEMPENMFYAVSSIQDFENRVTGEENFKLHQTKAFIFRDYIKYLPDEKREQLFPDYRQSER